MRFSESPSTTTVPGFDQPLANRTVVAFAHYDPAWTFDGEDGNDNLGTALDGVGDINGDGLSDLVIGVQNLNPMDSGFLILS